MFDVASICCEEACIHGKVILCVLIIVVKENYLIDYYFIKPRFFFGPVIRQPARLCQRLAEKREKAMYMYTIRRRGIVDRSYMG